MGRQSIAVNKAGIQQ